VLDPLRGYLILARQLYNEGTRFARAWNFGPPPSHEVTVDSVVGEFAHAWGTDARFEIETKAHFTEAAALRLNSELAQRELGWRTHIPLSQAVRMTAQWYLAYEAGDRAGDLVDADIAGLAKLALH
jgi:CDP-glucose 4,6-dehydratase